MPRKAKPKPDGLPCPVCGTMSLIIRGRIKCEHCAYLKAIETKKDKVRSCRVCGRSSLATPMRPERNVCRACFRVRDRQRQKYKKFGYPPCGCCEVRPMVPKNDGMCQVCSAVADEVDLIVEEAV